VITEFHDPATHGNIIPPRIADGSLSSGLNHPPAAYTISTFPRPKSTRKTHLQLARIPWVLVDDAVEERNYAAYEDSDEGEAADAW
jgi:hypothetical protein